MKDNFEKYKEKLSIEDFPNDLHIFYRCINNYHSVVCSADNPDLTVGDLGNLVFAGGVKDKEFVNGILSSISGIVCNDYSVVELINALHRNNKLRELSLLAYDVSEGRGKLDNVFEITDSLGAESDLAAEEAEDEFVDFDLVELLSRRRSFPGLRWRLNTLNKMLGPIRKGNFGFIFARPETGKTTLLASEVTFMAGQLAPDAGPIIWFNNEQEKDAVVSRITQASIGCDLIELYRNPKTSHEKYLEVTQNKIRLVDNAQIQKSYVEKLCERYQPSLLVFDQIDKIHGFANDREDLRLGSIYIWARELAKKYCPVIGVCQADGTGEGQRWLTMANVANAKTAKQAEADWILGIGKVSDNGYENIRYLHASKNKLDGNEQTIPELRHGKVEVILKPEIARYDDIQYSA